MDAVGYVMAVILAATIGGQPGPSPQPGEGSQAVDARLIADLELIRMLDVLRDLDTIRQMDEVMGPVRADRKGQQGKGP